jgi:hypothetical protein
MSEKRFYGGQVTYQRHRDRSNNQGVRGNTYPGLNGKQMSGKYKGQINKCDAEKGNMCKANHPPSPGWVSSEPIFLIKKQAWNGSRNATCQKSYPYCIQIYDHGLALINIFVSVKLRES